MFVKVVKERGKKVLSIILCVCDKKLALTHYSPHFSPFDT